MIKYDVVVIIMSEHEEETLPLLVANHAKKQSEKVSAPNTSLLLHLFIGYLLHSVPRYFPTSNDSFN